MTAVTYTAARSLISGHTAGSAYSLDIRCTDVTPARKVENEVQKSLDGTRETLRYSAAMRYDVSTEPLSGAALDALLEFLDSVESGELFTFDPYGSTATPVAAVTAELDDVNGYSLNRSTRKGQGGANDFFTVSFNVRVRK